MSKLFSGSEQLITNPLVVEEGKFQQFYSSDILKPYIKCYWIYKTDKGVFKEIIYPSGYVELVINISTGNVSTIINDRCIQMPALEVLGQLTSPAKLLASEKTVLLITRFFPHATALFFPNHISSFTNNSIDLYDVFKNEASELFEQLVAQSSIEQKINLLNFFLIRQLKKNERKQEKLKLVEHICNYIHSDSELFNVKSIAAQYGFSERYIQKLFLDFVGLTPKFFFNIQRFNKSLELLRLSNSSLTSIAYACGYYDQSHFIKEFRAFTGTTPFKYQHSSV